MLAAHRTQSDLGAEIMCSRHNNTHFTTKQQHFRYVCTYVYLRVLVNVTSEPVNAQHDLVP